VSTPPNPLHRGVDERLAGCTDGQVNDVAQSLCVRCAQFRPQLRYTFGRYVGDDEVGVTLREAAARPSPYSAPVITTVLAEKFSIGSLSNIFFSAAVQSSA
jgi:hypothetical protein